MTPTFNIITPSYQQADFIEQTLRSVQDQHYPTVAHYVMDGGSTDGTLAILKRFKQSCSWISKPDKGQSDALNKGWKRVLADADDNDIIAYINSDDYYLAGAFERVAAIFATQPEAQWVVGDACIVDEQGKEIQQPIRWYKRLLRAVYQGWMLAIVNPIPQPAVFIRVKAAKRVGLFSQELRYTMDYEYWLRLQNIVGNPVFISAPLAAFRIHHLSKGSTRYEQQFDEELAVEQRQGFSPLLHSLHQLHVLLIKTVYRILKG